MKEKRISPMKGRKISLEDRGPDAPKLGRKFNYIESEVIKVSLTWSKGTLEQLLKATKTKSKAKAITEVVESFLGE